MIEPTFLGILSQPLESVVSQYQTQLESNIFISLMLVFASAAAFA